MNNNSKVFALFIIVILAVSTLIIIKPTYAQTMLKPSVPEFTLKYVDNSYDAPPTYGTDPYTGKNVVTQAGYHIQNKSIEITIKNQPVTSYRNENNSLVGLWYYVLVKGHFQDWYTGTPNVDRYIYRSDSECTVVGCGLSGNNGSDPYRGNIWIGESGIISDGAQIDFKIQALIGYKTQVSEGPYAYPFGESYHYVFTGESSGWSSIQTIKLSDGSVVTTQPTSSPIPTNLSTSPIQRPSASALQPDIQSDVLFGLGWVGVAVVVLLGVIAVLLICVVVYLRKRSIVPK